MLRLGVYVKIDLRTEVFTLADLAALQQILGVSFNNLSLLEQALVHSSYTNESPGFAPFPNERLEFLGDAVLGFVITEKLYQDFPYLTEGEMTRLRATLVCGDTLARISTTFELGDYLYLGKGEESSGGRYKPTNLAGTLEALIAAVFLDQGLVTARDFILRLLDKELRKIAYQGVEVDYKTQLQELIQSRQQPTPVYYVVESAGPDHDKRFTIEVRVGDSVLGRGAGKNKRLAETEAARLALERLLIDFTQ
jgi:ribonuclease-3